MIYTDGDTICAISTPAGRGGIAVARISGRQAIAVAQKIWHGKPLCDVATHTAHLGAVDDCEGAPLDQAVATVFKAPRSFTGEDVVELSVHGSTYVQRALIAALIAAGARLAAPGEFTQRAFAARKMDLAQAEAIADIIAADSRAAHRLAATQLRGSFSAQLTELRQQLVDLASLLELELDFSEEDVEFASRERLKALANDIYKVVKHLHGSFSAGNAIKSGIPVAIVGPTNAGKSSLLNALVGDDRAIVSDIHGTTRDTIEEVLAIGDYTFRLIDTAGIRHSDDSIEQIGIQRSLQAIERASIVVVLNDITTELPTDSIEMINRIAADPDKHVVLALSKSDLVCDSVDINAIKARIDAPDIVVESITTALHGGIDGLRNALQNIADRMSAHGVADVMVTNLRHAEALGAAAESTERVISGLRDGIPADLIAEDVRETIAHLSDITGDIPSSELLNTIFSRFCIGK
ncbi:MAG: tRNA uridine-5-carboxymethylaminomethyl(34) synthesis GTPase MnmE [Muribaculaceae bacterium]